MAPVPKGVQCWIEDAVGQDRTVGKKDFPPHHPFPLAVFLISHHPCNDHVLINNDFRSSKLIPVAAPTQSNYLFLRLHRKGWRN